MIEKKVLVLKNFSLPNKGGVYHRILCMTGRGKGESYFLTGNRILIGRNEIADIKVFDVKSSRDHAEIVKVAENYVITDLGSQNGVIVNDLKINQYSLKDGDRIIIGQTVFKYSIVNVEDKGENASTDDEVRDDSNSKKSDLNPKSKDKKGNKKLVMFLFLFIAGYFLLDSDSPKENKKNTKKKNKNVEVTDDFMRLYTKKKLEANREMEEKLNSIFQRGLREARERNYFRAIDEFNLALILSPNNARASFYLRVTKKKLDDEIEQHFIDGRKAMYALRYSGAINSYCSIIRLLQKFPEDEKHKFALNNIRELELKMGLNEGEINCL